MPSVCCRGGSLLQQDVAVLMMKGSVSAKEGLPFVFMVIPLFVEFRFHQFYILLLECLVLYNLYHLQLEDIQ